MKLQLKAIEARGGPGEVPLRGFCAGTHALSRTVTPVCPFTQLMASRSSSDRPVGNDEGLRGVGGPLLVGVSLLILTLGVYAPALLGGPLWDDSFHITSPALQSFRGLFRIWVQPGATQQYYPLLHSAFWIEHRLWGDAVLGYHLANVALHALNAFLVVRVLRALSVPGAVLAGLVFAVHPVCVESVAWISEQKNTLSLAFYLLSALAYLHFCGSRRLGYAALASFLFVCALLSKSVTATLPAALMVVLVAKEGYSGFRRHLPFLGPLMVLGLASGLFSAWIERHVVGAAGDAYALSGMQRVLLAGRVVWFYALKAVWPVSLSFVYPRWTLDVGRIQQWVYPALAAAGAVGAILGWRRRPWPSSVVLVYLGTLIPVMGFVNVYPFAYSFVADHFQYHAMIPLIALASAAWARARDQAERSRSTARIGCLYGVAFLLVATLAGLGRARSADFRSSETLYRATLAVNPGAAVAHNNLGVILASEGQFSEATEHFNAAVRLKPDYAEAHNNLADQLARAPATLQEAISHYREALRLRGDYVVAHVNLADQLACLPGGWAEAEQQFEEALRIDPRYAKGHNDFALALAARPGRRAEALAHYREALALAPEDAQAHANYAFELAKTPDGARGALAHYAKALELNPRDPVTHNNLGNLLANLPGREDEALVHYREALRLRPDYPEAHNNLANGLARDPARLAEAIEHYETAVRLEPDYAEAHNNLAIAYANVGRLSEAEAHFRRALAIRPDFPQARENLRALGIATGR